MIIIFKNMTINECDIVEEREHEHVHEHEDMVTDVVDDVHRKCSHYSRQCQVIAPCCGKIYDCIYCHDETEDHQMHVDDITNIVCRQCHLRQPIGHCCQGCHICFGEDRKS